MKKPDKTENKKFLYSIGEVASMFNLKESTLRYWEKEFTQLKPQKYSGERKYTQQDIETVRKIHYLLKVKKLTIKGAKAEMKRRHSNILKNYYLYEELQAIKKKLLWLKKIIEENA